MKNTINTKQKPTIPHEVSKKLVLSFPPDTVGSGKRVPLEAATAISEALRLFLVDAHHRALIEAECDNEGDFKDDTNKTGADTQTPVGANHVTRIAGDLLMDFS